MLHDAVAQQSTAMPEHIAPGVISDADEQH